LQRFRQYRPREINVKVKKNDHGVKVLESALGKAVKKRFTWQCAFSLQFNLAQW